MLLLMRLEPYGCIWWPQEAGSDPGTQPTSQRRPPPIYHSRRLEPPSVAQTTNLVTRRVGPPCFQSRLDLLSFFVFFFCPELIPSTTLDINIFLYVVETESNKGSFEKSVTGTIEWWYFGGLSVVLLMWKLFVAVNFMMNHGDWVVCFFELGVNWIEQV